MLQLYVKNNWLKEEHYTLYNGELLTFPSHLFFNLKWGDRFVTSIHIDDQLLYVGKEGKSSFSFQLTNVAERTELRVRYKDEEGLHDELLTIHFDLSLYPTENVLVKSIKEPLFNILSDWTTIARELGESTIEFDDDLIQERSNNVNRSLEQFLKQLKEDDEYIFFRERRNILVLIERVIMNPKKKLIDREQLVHASEATVISPRTIQHFMQETSTWSGVSFGNPRPNKLLQIYQDESIDLYENRFVFTFIKLVIQQIRSLQLKMMQMLDNIESNEQDLLFRESQDLLTDFDQPVLERLSSEKNQLQQLLSEVKTFEGQLKKQLLFFKGFRDIRGNVQPNQVLQQNPFYGKLYKYYNNYLRKSGNHSSKKPDPIDFITYYSDFIYLDLIRVLRQLQFYPENGVVTLPINPDPDGYFLTLEAMEHVFKAGDNSPFSIKLTRPALSTREENVAHIVITFSNDETKETKQIQLLPTLTSFKKEITKETIMYLYGRQDEMSATYVLYPMETNDEYVSMPYELAQYLFNIDGRFIDPIEREKYGNFRYGMFQYSTHQRLSYDLLLRIIKIFLFRIGHHHRCFLCNFPGKSTKIKNTKYSYKCSNSSCKVEWGSSTCPKCGGELLQMRVPKNRNNMREQNEERLRNMKAIEWIIRNESKNAKNSLDNLCENASRDNGFFVICPSCGDCHRSSSTHRICQYCDAKERFN